MRVSDKIQIVENFLACLDKLVEFTQVESDTGIETSDLVLVLRIGIYID
jgi:hypothetical protein